MQNFLAHWMKQSSCINWKLWKLACLPKATRNALRWIDFLVSSDCDIHVYKGREVRRVTTISAMKKWDEFRAVLHLLKWHLNLQKTLLISSQNSEKFWAIEIYFVLIFQQTCKHRMKKNKFLMHLVKNEFYTHWIKQNIKTHTEWIGSSTVKNWYQQTTFTYRHSLITPGDWTKTFIHSKLKKSIENILERIQH